MSVATNERVRAAAATVAVFVLVGVALGVAGAVSMSWAQSQFLVPGGNQRTRVLGQLFVAVVYFQSTVVLFLLGPTIAAVLGLGFGSRVRSDAAAAAVSAGSSLLGFLLMATVAVLLMGLGLGPAGSVQAYSLGTALGPMVLAGVATTLSGGGAGALGARLR